MAVVFFKVLKSYSRKKEMLCVKSLHVILLDDSAWQHEELGGEMKFQQGPRIGRFLNQLHVIHTI